MLHGACLILCFIEYYSAYLYMYSCLKIYFRRLSVQEVVELVAPAPRFCFLSVCLCKYDNFKLTFNLGLNRRLLNSLKNIEFLQENFYQIHFAFNSKRGCGINACVNSSFPLLPLWLLIAIMIARRSNIIVIGVVLICFP